jgi:hypothetical protein
MAKWWKLWLGVLAIVAMLLASWLCLPLPSLAPFAWQDESQVRLGVRLGMADRLIAHRTLLGKTQAEVIEFLGEPPTTAYFANWDMVYWLGLATA